MHEAGTETRDLLTAAAALLLALSAGCAKESLLGVESPRGAYWSGYYDDARDALSQPREWEGRDWLILTGLAGTTFALGAADADIRDAIQGSRSEFTEGLAWFGEKMGNLSILLPLAAGYGLGCALDDPRLKEATLLGTEGLVLAGLATNVFKHLVGRARPNVGVGPGEFLGPSFRDGYRSWPSGHATVAFAVATAFHLEYRSKWVSVLAYTLAAVGGWSRMHDDKHWASDVFAGAAIGIVTTNAIFRARRRRGR